MAALQSVLAKHTLILGSSSSSRRAILQNLGVPFSVVAAGIDEQAIRRDTPEALVIALAHAKADAVLAKLRSPSGAVTADSARSPLLITADQVVVHDGRILEKPADAAQARSFPQRAVIVIIIIITGYYCHYFPEIEHYPGACSGTHLPLATLGSPPLLGRR